MKKLIVLMIILICATAYAIPGYLVSTTDVGQWRYCKYDDGRVITIKLYQLCPLTIK